MAQTLLEPTTRIPLDRRLKILRAFPETLTVSLMDGPGPFMNSPFVISATLHSRSPDVRIPKFSKWLRSFWNFTNRESTMQWLQKSLVTPNPQISIWGFLYEINDYCWYGSDNIYPFWVLDYWKILNPNPLTSLWDPMDHGVSYFSMKHLHRPFQLLSCMTSQRLNSVCLPLDWMTIGSLN